MFVLIYAITMLTACYIVDLVSPSLLPTRYYDPRYITREQGQMLTIPHVRESDNGEYCCIATNGIGEPAKSCGALQLKMSMSAFFLRFHT